MYIFWFQNIKVVKIREKVLNNNCKITIPVEIKLKQTKETAIP